MATCADVGADPASKLRVTRIVAARECGPVVSPETVPGQIEGGTIMALWVLVDRAGIAPAGKALASACRVYGASRLLLGTDYPYCDEPQFRHHLSYLSDAGLDTAELAQIKGGTAAALLGAGAVAA